MNKLLLIKQSFICVLLIAIASIGSTIRSKNVEIKEPEIIYANPGEDCSKEITISWHAPLSSCDLYYTIENDTEFKQAKKLTVNGIYNDDTFKYNDVAKYYRYSVELKDLIPDTNYIYKIICGGSKSEVRSFKTAGAGEFTFGYMSDIHAVPYDNLSLGMTAENRMKTVQKLIDQSTLTSGDLSFILTTGDEVWRGSQYTNWEEWNKLQYTTATADYLWFSCPGNHDYYTQVTDSIWNYYPEKYEGHTGSVYSDKEYFYNSYFNQVKSVPQNGPEGIPSSYYTIYNNVLFICIDSMQANEYNKLKVLRNWFEEVCTANQGKYQYIIAYEHYPWYDFQTGAEESVNDWSDLFDKYGVDLALSGHMHGYLRTKSLYDGKVSNDNSKGTVYVVSPQVGDRAKEITENLNENLFASRMSTVSFDSYSAMSTIKVTKTGITYQLIDVNGKVKDEFTIQARRDFTCSEIVKEDIVDSLSVSATENSIIVDTNKSLVSYINKIEIDVNNKQYIENTDKTKHSYVIAKSLNNNTIYEPKIRITFADNTTYEKTIKILTSEEYNLIYQINITGGERVKLSWGASSIYSIAKYKIYLNDVFVEMIDGQRNNYNIDRSKLSCDTKITLEGINANGAIIYRNDFYYTMHGDINLDGKINQEDVNTLINFLFDNTKFSDQAIELMDNNGDGILDIGDAYRIISFEKGIVKNIVSKEYDVIFVNENGEIISTCTVKEGENAVPPTVDQVPGKTFIGWSLSCNNITNDKIIRAIYK